LISLQLATAGDHRFVLVDNRQSMSVMVNEEDHLRIQAILPGLQLDAAWRLADRIDAFFGDHLQYAEDNEYGYLTASLGNCGTGLRASVMVHLPGLAWLNKLPEVLAAVRSLGTSVRGLYGEDGGAAGDVYQLSNAISLGLNPRQIVARLAAVTTYLVTEEQAITERLSRYAKGVIGSRVGEAAAALSKAEQLCGTEAMALLSTLRLGERVGIPTGIDSAAFSELLVSMRIGAQFLSGNKARYTFFEETRRPALIRNKIREQQRNV
jgi:protein arginine kinase